MKTALVRKVVGVCILAAATAIVVGCGVSQETLDDAERRMNELVEKGVPDSALSQVKVYLFEAQDAKERGDGGRARKAADSLLLALEDAEKLYEEHISQLQPVIDSLVAEADKIRDDISGLQLHKLDSIKGAIDSLAKANRPVEAEKLARTLVPYTDTLLQDEKKAQTLRKTVPGVWVCINRKKSDVHTVVDAVEKKEFTFKHDGKAVFVESEHGRSEPGLKKDYKFISYGRYGIAGDTIKVFVDRFVAAQQTFHVLHEKDGKQHWEKEVGPTYDSTITDGSQDRFILMSDLKEDFVKKR